MSDQTAQTVSDFSEMCLSRELVLGVRVVCQI
jgi:hypothetical protein